LVRWSDLTRLAAGVAKQDSPIFAAMSDEEMDEPGEEAAEEAVEVQGNKEELFTLLAEFDTAMLVTIEEDGTLAARPMGIQRERLADCDLWFPTADDTRKTDEIERHHEVNVCCMRTRDRAYVSVSARARIDRNAAEARRLWQPGWRIWFGDDKPEDGGIVLLKLDIERAEYWDPEGGRLRVIYALLRNDLSAPPHAST
jgi:general stress protein 26